MGEKRDVTLTRRGFLVGAGLGVAGALTAEQVLHRTAPGNAHAITEGAGAVLAGAPQAFEHLVVLMLENRSFDHLLGWLYTEGEASQVGPVKGIYAQPPVNIGPAGDVVAPYIYTGGPSRVLTSPSTNAGEDLGHVNRQLFGDGAPGGRPTMSGFVADYVENFRSLRGREPSPDEYRQVMGRFPSTALPVLSTLARRFAVFDHWFAAVPSDTFCNRSFVSSATSHGFVTNADSGGYEKWLDAPAVPTIFNRLGDAHLPWRVYYDETQVVSLTGILAAPSIEPFWKTNFRDMAQFHQDAAQGKLPAYSFIEPRMIFNRNSMHPPTIASPDVPTDGSSDYNKGVSDMLAAEALVAEVYESIRRSSATSGSNANNTALVITFDEAGGLFDHVPPPSAAPPDDGAPPGEQGFAFDRLGCRVPAIFVSAWTDQGTVISETVDHSSVISTMCAQHGLAPLTDRDVASRRLFSAITRTTPRAASSWPVLIPPRIPVPPDSITDARNRAQTSTGLGILGLVLAKYAPSAPRPRSIPTAFDTLADRGIGLFGTRDSN